jgi:glyoxylase-like metal-dependent hydrolase (beta-lactamase superfamily II)
MRVHAIQTGTVRIKASQFEGRGPAPLRQLRILTDPQWTESLPILAWAVEADDGVIVVDTGETAKATGPGYFPSWHPYFRRSVRIEVEPEQEIGPRLREIGISPEDVGTVIITHLHTDHVGGLHHFPKAEVLISDAELRQAHGLAGRLRGYLPDRWPVWFAPRAIPFGPEPYGPFARSFRATRDGRVVVVPTHGHTAGHVSVVVDDGDLAYFLAGDTSYCERALVGRTIDGLSPIARVTRRTLGEILEFAGNRPTVYLPSHDPESAERLRFRATVGISGTATTP